jgi:6-phosphofructokinase 1
MKRIGVLTGGGDAAGMNAALRAVTRTAWARGVEVVGINRGWEGLAEADVRVMGPGSVSGILHLGGTILRTFRYPEFAEDKGTAKIGKALKKLRLDGMVIIGGDGSFRGAEKIERVFGVPVVGVPATIDNDIPGTDMAIGYDTALNIAVDAVDKVRDTASSHGRIFVVEVMGRDYGLLAVQTAIACGAEDVLIPEIPYDIDAVCKNIEAGYTKGKYHAIIIVAEGAGKASYVTYEINNRLQREARMVVLGHVQRGGAPSAFDRILATRLSHHATDLLLNGEHGLMVGLVSSRMKTSPLIKRGGPDLKVLRLAYEMQQLLA